VLRQQRKDRASRGDGGVSEKANTANTHWQAHVQSPVAGASVPGGLMSGGEALGAE
jgi:hypothetical protein